MTLREKPPNPVGIPTEERPVAFEDLTARARIREAALEQFARERYERATIRAIAQTAGLSRTVPSPLRIEGRPASGLRSLRV